MSDSLVKKFKQDAIYWGNPKSDGRGGYTFDYPIEIKCRWERLTLVELASISVNKNVEDSVYVAIDLDENGMLLEGNLVDLDSAEIADPILANASTIVRFDKIPSLNAKKFLRCAYVGRLYLGK